MLIAVIKVYPGDTIQASISDWTQGDGRDPEWHGSFYVVRNPADNLPPLVADVSLDLAKDRKSAHFHANLH